MMWPFVNKLDALLNRIFLIKANEENLIIWHWK